MIKIQGFNLKKSENHEDLLSNKTQDKYLQMPVVTFKKVNTQPVKQFLYIKPHILTVKQKPYCLDLIPN